MSLFTKSKNLGNFAALLNVELFDKETRKSNVRGQGKEKLAIDPEIIIIRCAFQVNVQSSCIILYSAL